MLLPTFRNLGKTSQFCPTPPRGNEATSSPDQPSILAAVPVCFLASLKLCTRHRRPRLGFKGKDRTHGSQHDFTKVGHLKARTLPNLPQVAGQGLENLSNDVGRSIITFIANVVDRRALLVIEPSQDVSWVLPLAASAISAFFPSNYFLRTVNRLRSRRGISRYLGRSMPIFQFSSVFREAFPLLLALSSADARLMTPTKKELFHKDQKTQPNHDGHVGHVEI